MKVRVLLPRPNLTRDSIIWQCKLIYTIKCLVYLWVGYREMPLAVGLFLLVCERKNLASLFFLSLRYFVSLQEKKSLSRNSSFFPAFLRGRGCLLYPSSPKEILGQIWYSQYQRVVWNDLFCLSYTKGKLAIPFQNIWIKKSCLLWIPKDWWKC